MLMCYKTEKYSLAYKRVQILNYNLNYTIDYCNIFCNKYCMSDTRIKFKK